MLITVCPGYFIIYNISMQSETQYNSFFVYGLRSHTLLQKNLDSTIIVEFNISMTRANPFLIVYGHKMYFAVSLRTALVILF